MSTLGVNPDVPTQFRFLPVLDGGPAEEVVQLDGLVRRDGRFVLAGVLAQPEVDVLLQTGALHVLNLDVDAAGSAILRGAVDDVGVAVVKLAQVLP